jgi:hypothetical protein
MSRTSFPIELPVHKKVVKWNTNLIRLVYQLCLLGHTDEEVAKVMEVSIHTINSWKRTHPEFLKAMNEGKEIADAQVANAFYKRAVGFWVDEIHVCMYRGEVIQTTIPKYYPPDSWAANKWLNVRQRTKWSEVQRIDIQHTNLNLHKFDFSGMTIEQLRFMKEIGMDQRQKALEENYDGNG